MMTPKEKAEAIMRLCRMAVGTPINKTKSWCYSRHAKNCALVVVDEVVLHCNQYEWQYWEEVKQEINKF